MSKHLKSLLPYLPLFCLIIGGCNSIPDDHLYLGQDPPGLTPKIFAPGIVSQATRHEFGSTFSEDGREFFLGIDRGNYNEILYRQYSDGLWKEEKKISPDTLFRYNDPILSPDQNRLYYISNRPENKSDSIADFNIWFSERTNQAWGPPAQIEPGINTAGNEFYISFSQSDRLYFSSNILAKNNNRQQDIYFKDINGEAVLLPETINSPYYEADAYVSPAEKYIIFCSVRPGGLGRGDLYISYRTDSDEWSEAQNLGAPINNSGHQLCPWVTSDGKYLFYTSDQDIYWVSTALFIE